MKKLIKNMITIMAVLSFASVLPAPAAAIDISAPAIIEEKGDLSGSLTSTMNYSLKGGILSITGSGDMPNWENYNYIPWKNEMGSIRAVNIGEGITSVGTGFLYEATGLQEVTLPSTVTRIYAYAFYGCTSLQSIKIPAAVTTLAGNALAGCTSLKTITFESTKCTISSTSFSFSQSGPTIKGYTGSTAEKFATTNNIPFVSIGQVPTQAPTQPPTQKPTQAPTQPPTQKPTQAPTQPPTQKPTEAPTQPPTQKPTEAPTQAQTQWQNPFPGGFPWTWPTKPAETQPATDPKPPAAAKLAGDANNDGRVNVADAVAVLQFIADQVKYGLDDNGKTNADCDGVPGLTGSDAMYIQKLDAGIVK
ncbi:MAG: leucine-rich repeat protein [Ruminococcus sp.]|nr:leucine-rich repeat protein [Ruminococcus sp.]